jgi:hypothetical protein
VNPLLVDKIPLLDQLYARIAKTAQGMGGAAVRTTEVRHFEGVIVESPRVEEVPALHVEMPNCFEVDFAPDRALEPPGNTLSVKARRIHHGSRKSDWRCTFVQGQWQADGPLSDDTIRACLTPSGPLPAQF